MEISSQRTSRALGALLSLAATLACGSGAAPVAAQGGAPPQGVSDGGSLGRAGSSAGQPAEGGAGNGGALTGAGAAGAANGGGGGAGGVPTASGGAAGDGGGSGVGPGAGGTAGSGGAAPYEPISFGTKLDPALQARESEALAKTLVDPSAPSYRAKGDQRRTYRFAEAGVDVPYRLCVPSDWDGSSPLPLVMFLHGAGNDESSYLDQNGKQMVKLAEEHGYLLVSPLGYGGAYGNFLRLNAGFSEPEEAAKLLAKRTPEDEKKQQLSEKDVINVLELVLHEYPVERSRMFLTGHSMGSGGTWYIGGKYASYWAALAPMSGPFVLERGYPWDALRGKPLLVTEGLSAASLADSRGLRDWLMAGGFAVSYEEVQADHPGMVPLVLPRVFAFFDGVK